MLQTSIDTYHSSGTHHSVIGAGAKFVGNQKKFSSKHSNSVALALSVASSSLIWKIYCVCAYFWPVPGRSGGGIGAGGGGSSGSSFGGDGGGSSSGSGPWGVYMRWLETSPVSSNDLLLKSKGQS